MIEFKYPYYTTLFVTDRAVRYWLEENNVKCVGSLCNGKLLFEDEQDLIVFKLKFGL